MKWATFLGSFLIGVAVSSFIRTMYGIYGWIIFFTIILGAGLIAWDCDRIPKPKKKRKPMKPSTKWLLIYMLAVIFFAFIFLISSGFNTLWAGVLRFIAILFMIAILIDWTSLREEKAMEKQK